MSKENKKFVFIKIATRKVEKNGMNDVKIKFYVIHGCIKIFFYFFVLRGQKNM